MTESVMDVVGSSPNFNLEGVCTQCDGDGQLETDEPGAIARMRGQASCAGRSRQTDELSVIVCPECKGTGGDNQENVAKARVAWEKYRVGLCGQWDANPPGRKAPGF